MRKYAHLLFAIALFFQEAVGRSEPYVVKKDDTLYAIARKHGLTLRALLQANPEYQDKSTHSHLKVGDPLVVPEPYPGMPPDTPEIERGGHPPDEPKPQSAGQVSAVVQDGVASQGWVVTHNSNIDPNLLFIHQSIVGRSLTKLLYYIKVGQDGQWSVYAPDSPPGWSKSVPLTVMSPPSVASIAECPCVPYARKKATSDD